MKTRERQRPNQVELAKPSEEFAGGSFDDELICFLKDNPGCCVENRLSRKQELGNPGRRLWQFTSREMTVAWTKTVPRSRDSGHIK